MSNFTRHCPFVACDTPIPSDCFCCRRHWWELSEEHRTRIYAVWNGYRQGEVTIQELRHEQETVLQLHYGSIRHGSHPRPLRPHFSEELPS